MGRRGPPPQPVERKRAAGNPGKRALPAVGQVVALAAAVDVPEPPRPLATAGLALWARAWRAARHWLSPETDLELVLIVCEQVDERVQLRVRVLTTTGRGEQEWEDRKALRKLDAAIVSNLSLLGFTPTDRARLGLAEVVAASKLEELRRARQP